MEKNTQLKLAIPTDAISMDIETSFLVGLDWGIQHYELKRLFITIKILQIVEYRNMLLSFYKSHNST